MDGSYWRYRILGWKRWPHRPSLSEIKIILIVIYYHLFGMWFRWTTELISIFTFNLKNCCGWRRNCFRWLWFLVCRQRRKAMFIRLQLFWKKLLYAAGRSRPRANISMLKQFWNVLRRTRRHHFDRFWVHMIVRQMCSHWWRNAGPIIQRSGHRSQRFAPPYDI